jgi:hypothetical protein
VPYEPAEIYADLREQVLALTPADLGADAAAGPLAALMETGYPEAVATLVAVADGTTSLYFSNGGGMIGGGEHPQVREAARRWLDAVGDALGALSPADDVPLPEEGMTQFVVVTAKGRRAESAVEDDLGEGRHELSPLFHAAHDVITELRLVSGEET